MEVLFHNEALGIVEAGDVKKVAYLHPSVDKPHILANDDGALHTTPCIGRELLANPLAWVEEVGSA